MYKVYKKKITPCKRKNDFFFHVSGLPIQSNEHALTKLTTVRIATAKDTGE